MQLKFSNLVRRISLNGLLASLVCGIFCSLIPAFELSAEAAGPTQYALGLQAYKARQYPQAAAYFRAAIAKEGAGADAWLYLGHSFYAAGDRASASQTYKTLRANTNKFSPQSIAAGQSLRLIDMTNPANFGRAAIVDGAPASAAAAMSGKPSDSSSLFSVQAPKINHPEASSAAIGAIRSAYDGLPPGVKQMLVAGRIQVVVTPTMIDKYPAGAYQERVGYNGATDKSCDGCFTNRTLVVAERKINERTDEVYGPNNPANMQETFWHETGHAVDVCLNNYSQSAEFKAAYIADVAKMSDDEKARLSYFMQKNGQGQAETFAELTSSLLGNHRLAAGEMVANCPSCLKLIQAKLGI